MTVCQASNTERERRGGRDGAMRVDFARGVHRRLCEVRVAQKRRLPQLSNIASAPVRGGWRLCRAPVAGVGKFAWYADRRRPRFDRRIARPIRPHRLHIRDLDRSLSTAVRGLILARLDCPIVTASAEGYLEGGRARLPHRPRDLTTGRPVGCGDPHRSRYPCRLGRGLGVPGRYADGTTAVTRMAPSRRGPPSLTHLRQ
jgi:hypothetical protein